jgi:hypothetical protein
MTYAEELQKASDAITAAYSGATPKYGLQKGGTFITGWDQPGLRNYSTETAVLDPVTGLYRSSKTGALWTGDVIKNGAVLKTQGGKLLPTDAYGNTLPVFTAQTTVKQPEIDAASGRLLNQFNDNSTALTKSFTDYLNQAKAINEQGAAQLKLDQAAVNPDGTINRLNTGAASTTGELRAINRDYTAGQRGVQEKVSGENVSAAQTTADRLARLKSDLTAENAAYESAAQNVARQAFDRASQQIKAGQLIGGTPMSGSGQLSNRYLRSYAAINVPLQADLAARRYTQTATLDELQRQADAEAYANLMREYAGESALNTDVANRNYSTAQYAGSLDAQTAMQIQQLKLATAGMSRAQAAEYLRQLQVPLFVGQQVLGAEAQNLGQLQGIETNANYYNLFTPYESRVPAVPYYQSTIPNRSYTPRPIDTSRVSLEAPTSPAMAEAVAASIASGQTSAPLQVSAPRDYGTPAWSSLGGGRYQRNSDGVVGMFDANGKFSPLPNQPPISQ